MWYCRHEIQFRQALFFSAASVAGALSGLLAFGIAKIDGVGGLEGRRWVFILEGIATVLVSEERAFVVFRLKYQSQRPVRGQEEEASQTRVAEADEFKWACVWSGFKDCQMWVITFVYWGIVCLLYGISLFLPTIIRNLGYTSSSSQLLTILIYITAAILASPANQNYKCISSGTPKVVYGGVFIATCAIYPAFPDVISWLASNLSGSYKRSFGMAIQIGIGNLGGAMASNFYRTKDGHRYKLGHALELGFISAGIVAALILIVGHDPIYKGRSRKVAAGEHNQYSGEELSAKGDETLTWRYMH
ncbi:hypothetical protein HZS61_005365 [Fusarium oxysporum f. sp. conglutinans]|uniref:Major facilitator superfamily (MFS) profile domain-containing protein n=1 Tax=Fusarium oxysporum f. sp. conglutinans TaxID=100902 RepID=A0A8H6GBY2_FUSOX|nr:hypothetical protein HZS61_005365 [Fusarium oxysporum f. sp. conglutinans]